VPEGSQAGLGTEPIAPDGPESRLAAAPSDATAVLKPDWATPPAATGVYQPEAARSPAKQAALNYDPNATGAFAEKGAAGLDKGSPTPDFATPQAGATLDPVSTLREASAPAEPQCGRYVLKRFHAKGGMGEIWLAEDPAIGRPVALKRMLGRRPDQQRRFRVEAQVTGQLEHPGIVPVHELGTTEEGLPFYAMKFVRGRTLQKVAQEFHEKAEDAKDREVEQFRLLQIFISLCQTVAYAHSRGVLHRDLKPENVMLGPYGETLLLDWGIAKVLGKSEDAPASGESSHVHIEEGAVETGTRAGAIMGSPSYMAPEVAAGLNEEVDERSDVYLLGATLYEVLTGQLPRQAKTVMELIRKAQREPPVPPRKVNPRVSKALDAICLKAMATRKEDRYPSALALADDVQRYVAGEPVSVCPEGWVART
jgi:serine/threonine protein kinase